MVNKINFLSLGYMYDGEIIIGEIECFRTDETLKFYYSYYEDVFYATEDKPSVVELLKKDGILERDKGILTFNKEILNFIEDKLRGTEDIDKYNVA